MPRGRWYLNERPTSFTPLATSAEARVSPENPTMDLPSKVKLSGWERSIRPPPASRCDCAAATACLLACDLAGAWLSKRRGIDTAPCPGRWLDCELVMIAHLRPRLASAALRRRARHLRP